MWSTHSHKGGWEGAGYRPHGTTATQIQRKCSSHNFLLGGPAGAPGAATESELAPAVPPSVSILSSRDHLPRGGDLSQKPQEGLGL